MGDSYCTDDDFGICEPAESESNMSEEVLSSSPDEMRQSNAQENARVAESTQAFLPDFSIEELSDTLSALGSGIQDALSNAAAAACADVPVDASLKADKLEDLFIEDKNFLRLDRDSDGYVSEEEIDKAVVDPCFKGKDAQMVAALRKHREKIEELSNDEVGDENDGITKADMAALTELANKSEISESEQKILDKINLSLYKSGDSIANANRDLFADSAEPLACINPESVKQGQIGDCYFVAALASLAKTDEGKQAIYDMIQDNGDGTYTVTFPGDPDKPVTIDAPTDSELGSYVRGSKDGTWPAVIEKAFGKYSDQSNIDPHKGIPDGAIQPLGLKLLRSSSVDGDMVSFTGQDTTHNKLVQAMADKRPVTAGIAGEVFSFLISDNKTDDAGLPCGHEYSITEYDAENKIVTIRNPWGNGEPLDADGNALDGKPDGEFKMTLDQFEKNFSDLSYSE